MNDSTSTVARQVAQATVTFEQEQTGHVPQSVTMILSDEMLVIALQAVLSGVVETVAESPERPVVSSTIHEHPKYTAAGQPTHQRRETRQAAGEDARTTDSPSPFLTLRRWLADALQCGEMSLAEGIACMRALDDGERRMRD